MDLFALGAHRRTSWVVLGEQCVCVCVCGGGGGGGGGGGEQPPVPTLMSYVTVFKLYLGGGYFLCLLLLVCEVNTLLLSISLYSVLC